MSWETRASRTVYENRWIRVREDDVVRPDGGEGIYGVVEVRQPAVFVVPVTDAGEVVLIRMFRYTTGRESIEIPAGGTDGEDPLLAARRELREETGLEAASWEDLGPVWSLNGVADAPGRIYLARGLAPSEHADEMADEGITEVLTLPWAEVFELVRSGAIDDGETLAPLLRAAVVLGRLA
jgi:8-oxo-dGTP pyrophosphatase MutT (NUDIX family)